MPSRLSSRALVSVLVIVTGWTIASLTSSVLDAPSPAGAASEPVTVCHDATLPRQLTEVAADLSVPKFGPSLGTLQEVSVTRRELRLDTDSRFENTASSPSLLAEHMTYEVTLTQPETLGADVSLAGTIVRIPSQTVPAFDGTLDFAGPSSVSQPSVSRDAAALPQSLTDSAALAAFTGPGVILFHVATSIEEDFTSGGGNVAFDINTFVSAAVTVCYRYEPPAIPEPTTTTTVPEATTTTSTTSSPSTPVARFTG